MHQAAASPGAGAGEHGLRDDAARQPARLQPAIPSRTAAYEAALALVPDHAAVARRPRPTRRRAGRPGRGAIAVRAGRGDPAAARVRHRARRGPEAAGDDAEGARRATSWPGPRSRCSRRPASIVDLELALFEADHGDPARALELAEAAADARADGPDRRRRGLGAPSAGPRRGRARPRRGGASARLARSAAALPRRGHRGRTRRCDGRLAATSSSPWRRPRLLGDRRRRGARLLADLALIGPESSEPATRRICRRTVPA